MPWGLGGLRALCPGGCCAARGRHGALLLQHRRPQPRSLASPCQPIDSQLIFHVVVQGPWDKILSLWFIRNHGWPCCTGEVQKAHKVGVFSGYKIHRRLAPLGTGVVSELKISLPEIYVFQHI